MTDPGIARRGTRFWMGYNAEDEPIASIARGDVEPPSTSSHLH